MKVSLHICVVKVSRLINENLYSCVSPKFNRNISRNLN